MERALGCRASRGAPRRAARLRERRLELAALQVRECAKPWREADADVCEAIDFLEYYAREAMELERGRRLVQVPGERNTMRYAPRGVAAVISPWNFPLAIPLRHDRGRAGGRQRRGAQAGRAVAGQRPRCGGAARAGVPPGALALLPGYGDAGAALVRDPRVHVIAFTGSAAVGLEIVRAAAETPDEQGHVKRVVAEMGGKNCVIVDSDADLDEAVPGDRHSAFGYAGQKCSAAARVLVHEAIADPLVERLAGAVEVLEWARPRSFATEVPPVIDEEAQERVLRYASSPARRAIAASAEDVPPQGWFCAANVACDLPDGLARAARGDLRAAARGHARVRDVEQACDVIESLPFALTGGLFSRSPATVDRVTRRLPVGNLYVNRGITGRDGRAPAVRGQPPLGQRVEGGWPRLPAPVRRAARGHREHDAPRDTRRVGLPARRGPSLSCAP